MITLEAQNLNISSYLLTTSWQGKVKRNYYMKGSIKAAKGALCVRCSNSSFKSTLDEFFDLNVPKCTACGGAPSKLKLSKVIPTNDGVGVLKDFYKDLQGNPLLKIKDAVKLLANLNDDLKDGTFRPEAFDYKSREKLRFSNFANEYLEISTKRTMLPVEHQDYLSPAGFRSKQGLINNELKPYFKDRLITEIDKFDIQAFSRSYLSKFRTRDLAMGELRTMLRFAFYEMGLIQTVPPFPKISKARQKKVNEIPSREIQIEIINAISDEMYRTMWILAASLSKRPCEVRAYKVEDFDVKNRTLRTKGHFSKGPKGIGEQLIPGRKSIKQNEDFGELVDKLDDYLYGLLVKYVFGKTKDDFLFKGSRNSFVSQDALDDSWRKACKKTGHIFRPYDGTKHASLTEFLKRGGSLEQARAKAGHKSARMTETYAKIAAIDTSDFLDSEEFRLGSN